MCVCVAGLHVQFTSFHCGCSSAFEQRKGHVLCTTTAVRSPGGQPDQWNRDASHVSTVVVRPRLSIFCLTSWIDSPTETSSKGWLGKEGRNQGVHCSGSKGLVSSTALSRRRSKDPKIPVFCGKLKPIMPLLGDGS